MPDLIREYTDFIVSQLSSAPGDVDAKKLLLVSGIFGVGKSRLADAVRGELVGCGLPIISYNGHKKIDLITDVSQAFDFVPSDLADTSGLAMNECEYNSARFHELKETLRAAKPDLFGHVIRKSLVRKELKDDYKDKCTTRLSFDELDKALAEAIEKKGDRRLLLSSSVVVAESILVDLLIKYFPFFSTGGFPDDFSGITPQRIVFVFDNYYDADPKLTRFLFDYFIPYCFSAEFRDFVSFDINFADERARVTDLLDIRFLITSRHDLAEDASIDLSSYIDDSVSIPLSPLSRYEIPDFLAKENIDASDRLDTIEMATNGIQYLLELWCEAFRLGSYDEDANRIYTKAAERIFLGLTDEEQVWLRCAAFLDDFSRKGLACFPQMTGNIADAAFEFLSNSPALCCRTNIEGNYSVRNTIKFYLQEKTQRESKTLSEMFFDIASTYNKTRSFVTLHDEADFAAVRRLAYFTRFDEQFVPKAIGNGTVIDVQRLVGAYPQLFNKNKFTFSIRDEVRYALLEYNRLADRFDFEEHLAKARSIWEDFKAEKCRHSTEKAGERNLLTDEINWMHKRIKTSETEKQHRQNRLIEAENELIMLRKQTLAYSIQKKLTNAIIHALLAAVFVTLSLVLPSVFNQPDNPGFVVALNFLCYLIATGFGAFSLYFFANIIFVKSKKKDLETLNAAIQKAETLKQGIIQELSAFKRENEEYRQKITALQIKIEKVSAEIEECQCLNEEPFCDEAK